MANNSHCHCKRASAAPIDPPAVPSHQEPPMQRWPNPLEASVSPSSDSALHYIRCTLSYQNQLLAEIKALLEQIAEKTDDSTSEQP